MHADEARQKLLIGVHLRSSAFIRVKILASIHRVSRPTNGTGGG
jgi:hypothetical protein